MVLLFKILLAFTVSTGSFLLLYWVVFFPCIVLKSRFAIQKVCDDMHVAARNGTVSPESRGFIVLAHYIDIGRRAARHAEMLSVVRTSMLNSAEFEAFEREAEAIMKDAPEIREAFSTVARWILALWLAARPMQLLMLAPLLILAFFSESAAKKADREKKSGFVAAEGLPA